MNRLGVRRLFPYLLVGGVLWFFVLQSGVHATLAGVAVAVCIPMGRPEEEVRSPLLYLEEKLHYWVAFAVVPIFGFANAGVSLAGISMENLVDPVPMGVALGLLVGKQVGIFLLAALAIRMGLAKLPEGSTWGTALRRSTVVRHWLHYEPIHWQPGVRRISSFDR